MKKNKNKIYGGEKKGELTLVLREMGKLSKEERPIIGQLANDIRGGEIDKELSLARERIKEELKAERIEREKKST